MRWILKERLAGSHRPGYRGEAGGQVERAEVDAWLAGLREAGIGSIICLLDDEQLAFYAGLPGGLVAYYREAGFEVAHVPARDLSTPPLSDRQLRDVWEAFRRLPKPVLVHCSAGVDRTGAAVRHIQSQLETGD